MAASPLAAALLGGEGGAAGFNPAGYLDPNIAAAMPDLQIGQSLMQQGLSTAPASPWQALARVAQAGAGTLLQRGAISDLAKAYAHTADNMANVFPEGTPIGDMLRSPDPTVRMIGLQQAGKAALVGSEPYNLTAGTTRMTGRAPIAESTAPQTEAGKATADVRNEADRQAAESATGERPPAVRVPRPAGVPLAPPRFAQQPGGIESVTGMSAPVPAPVNAPPAQQTSFDDRFSAARPTSVPSNVLQPGINVGAEQTEANERAKANVEYGDLIKPQPPPKPGPGGTETMTTTHGTLIPPLTDQGPLPRSPAEAKEAVPAWQKTESEWNASVAPAHVAEQRLTTIAGALKSVESGAFTEQRADWAAKLRGAGLTSLADKVMAHPDQAQIILHETQLEVLTELKAALPRATQMEFRTIAANKENPDLTPEANFRLLQEDIGRVRQIQDLPTDYRQAKANGWRNPQAFEQAWTRQNPLSGYIKRVGDEIGPLKGMPGAESKPATPATAAPAAAQPIYATNPQTHERVMYDAASHSWIPARQ